MGVSIPKNCLMPGCPHRAIAFGRCDEHAAAIVREKNKQENERYHDQNPLRPLYRTARWFAVRQIVLARDPLCLRCLANNRTSPATEVHHVVRATVRPDLFFEIENLEGICKSCHSRETANEVGFGANQKEV